VSCRDRLILPVVAVSCATASMPPGPEGEWMSQNRSASYQSNGSNAKSACERCEGIISHGRLCQTLNPVVGDACAIVVSPDELTRGKP
jgi:hypothetical protein